MSQAKVLVTQMGARHNYALPAAFADHGMLEAFYTDLCGGRGFGRLAQMATNLPLPAPMRAKLAGIARRRPPAAVLKRTKTDDYHTLTYELSVRRAKTPAEARQIMVEHSRGSGERMARWGLGDATHVLNVFGAGGELIRLANSRGIPVLTDMIIALSTRRIVLEEYQRFPDWGPPPPDPDYSEVDGYNHDEHLLSTSDIFICPSQVVADDLADNFGIDRGRTRIIPYPLKGNWFGLETKPEKGRVLFAGTAERRKGIHYLAFAAQQLSEEIDIRIAGTVSEDVRNHPKASRLNFLGRVPREQIADEFSRADVFVLPSLAEGSATVIYEAMAAGVPVITTRAAGSIIRDGVDGIIVPESDPDALAAAIERIVEDRDLRSALSEAAKKNIAGLTWENHAAALRQLIADTPSPIADHRSYNAPFGQRTAKG